MSTTTRQTLTDDQWRQIRESDGKPIDTDDIPEAPHSNRAFRGPGALDRARAALATVRLDADILAWLQRQDEDVEQMTNRILRERMGATADPVG